MKVGFIKGIGILFAILSANAAAADIVELFQGDSIKIGNTTVMCGVELGGGSCSSESDNPVVACLKKGYSPSSCSRLESGCNGGQAACISRGYSPSSCTSIGVSSGLCFSATDNPIVACIKKGYPPSNCRSLENGCNSGQAACISRGYKPTSCDDVGVSSGLCSSSTDNPVVACIEKGYLPASCAALENGCNAGQAACINRGYSPSSCD